MTTTRKLIIAFWIFVIVMLIWTFATYNQGFVDEAAKHPEPQHYWFLHTNAPAAAAPVVKVDKADVIQTAFVVQPNTPAQGSFTCLVTLKNVGTLKALGVQISIRPYRGVSNEDDDVGGEHGGVLSDDDPLAQFHDWLEFPDLAPGESATRADVFTSRPEIRPGINPKPEILFKSDKAAAH